MLYLTLGCQGRPGGELCLSPHCRIPQTGMTASINLEILLTPPFPSGLQQGETRSLLHGVHEEIADGAFSPSEPKLITHFLLFTTWEGIRKLCTRAAGHQHGLLSLSSEPETNCGLGVPCPGSPSF